MNSSSNASFRDLEIPFELGTSERDPIADFFVPLLERASRYDVAVGYFSTGWIRDAAAGIAALAATGGASRWVVSPTLSAEDWALLSETDDASVREECVIRATSMEIEALQRALEQDTRVALGWLIRDGIITFRIAVPQNELSGIFHAKIGVFQDANGDEVAFSGSYNLTAAASTNWENIDVYLGWESSETKRVKAKRDQFEKIWKGLDPNLAIFMPTDRALSPFIEITQHFPRPYKLKQRPGAAGVPGIPLRFLNANNKLKDHQEEAIVEWFKNNGRGIYQLATGSGKTVSALATACKLSAFAAKNSKPLLILVSVPYKHLAEQWAKESADFGFDPLICFESSSVWAPKLQSRLLNLELGSSRLEFIITVNATFAGDNLQSMLQKVSCTFMFIADEMHNMGAAKIRKLLPANANFRLGLSATPVRHGDEIGTDALEQYFGPVVAEYSLADAIRDGTLTRYFYYPVMVEFTADEMERYHELSQRISQLFAQSGQQDEAKEAQLERLLFERARLVGSAENKFVKLRSMLSERRDSQFNLVYCGDAAIEGERAVERTLSLIGNEVGMRARKFTSDESLSERREILDQFASGELQTIVAIRCLDEGVDVPRTETAYILASSTDPRQYIQRRGRVLRRAEGKRFAYIYDFIVVPPASAHSDDSVFRIERKLVEKELIRVQEFASAAENVGDALQALRPIRRRLNLLDS